MAEEGNQEDVQMRWLTMILIAHMDNLFQRMTSMQYVVPKYVLAALHAQKQAFFFYPHTHLISVCIFDLH